jgi:hypothetical protein
MKSAQDLRHKRSVTFKAVGEVREFNEDAEPKAMIPRAAL